MLSGNLCRRCTPLHPWLIKAFLCDTFMCFSSSQYILFLCLTMCLTVCVWHFFTVFSHKHWPGMGFHFMSRFLQIVKFLLSLAHGGDVTLHTITRWVCWVGKTPQLDPTHRDDLFILGLSRREGCWSQGARKEKREEGGDTKMSEYLGSLWGPKQTLCRGPGLRAPH